MKRLLIFLPCLFVFLIAQSQKKDLSNLSTATVLSIQDIKYNDTLEGYFILSELDVVNKTEQQYSISVFDKELNSIKDINFNISIDAKIYDVKFNGETFCITYLLNSNQVFASKESLSKDVIYFDFIGLDGSKKTVKKEFAKKDNRYYLTTIPFEQTFSMPIKGKGFVLKFRGIIEAYSNTGELIWNQEGNIEFLGCSDDLILIKKNSEEINDKNMYTSIYTLEIYKFSNTIELLFEYKRPEVDSYIQIFDFLSNKDNVFLILGEFSWMESKKNKYPNMYKNPNNYKIVNFNKLSKSITVKEITGSFNETYSEKTTKAMGAIINVERFVISDVSIYNEKLNFIGFKYSENNLITLKHHEFDLNSSNIKTSNFDLNKSFGSNYAFIAPTIGYFTNQFESLPNPFGKPSNSGHLIFYQGISNATGNSMHLFFETIKTKNGRAENGMPTTELRSFKLNGLLVSDSEIKYSSPFNFELKSDYCQVLPAKPGYVCIFEYFEKEKKIDFRLEKFDF